MKSRIVTLTAAIFLLAALSPGKAKAFSFFPPSPPKPPVTPPVKTTTLPINNGVDFLIIAGVIMGVVAVRKSDADIKAAIAKI